MTELRQRTYRSWLGQETGHNNELLGRFFIALFFVLFLFLLFFFFGLFLGFFAGLDWRLRLGFQLMRERLDRDRLAGRERLARVAHAVEEVGDVLGVDRHAEG